jgi:hypothetical protein
LFQQVSQIGLYNSVSVASDRYLASFIFSGPFLRNRSAAGALRWHSELRRYLFTRDAAGVPPIVIFINAFINLFLVWLPITSSLNMTMALVSMSLFLLIAAFIRLKLKRPDLPRKWQVPGGTFGAFVIAIPCGLLCWANIGLGLVDSDNNFDPAPKIYFLVAAIVFGLFIHLLLNLHNKHTGFQPDDSEMATYRSESQLESISDREHPEFDTEPAGDRHIRLEDGTIMKVHASPDWAVREDVLADDVMFRIPLSPEKRRKSEDLGTVSPLDSSQVSVAQKPKKPTLSSKIKKAAVGVGKSRGVGKRQQGPSSRKRRKDSEGPELEMQSPQSEIRRTRNKMERSGMAVLEEESDFEDNLQHHHHKERTLSHPPEQTADTDSRTPLTILSHVTSANSTNPEQSELRDLSSGIVTSATVDEALAAQLAFTMATTAADMTATLTAIPTDAPTPSSQTSSMDSSTSIPFSASNIAPEPSNVTVLADQEPLPPTIVTNTDPSTTVTATAVAEESSESQ